VIAEIPIEGSAMRCELKSGHNLLASAEARGHILEVAPQQDGVFGHMKDAVAALSKDDERF
jgi:hypothetical protein